MSNINLKNLIDKLTPSSKQTLESAAGFCLSRTHYQVEIEHWLMKMLEQSESELNTLLGHFVIESHRLQSDLLTALTQLKTGNNRAPSLSLQLIAWMQSAWNYASLEFGAKQVNAGHLLYALLADEALQQLIKNTTPHLNKLSAETLAPVLLQLSSSTHDTTAISKSNVDTSALNAYTHDLTQQAREGRIDPVPGRDNEIRQIIDILTRRRQNNPILVGEAGVGKTAIVEGLALKVIKAEVPPVLQDVCIRVLDLALLQAGAGIKGEFENRLQSIIQAVKQATQPTILFIDEAHTLIGAGGQAGQGDAANLLKPALARGELRTIASTTWAEYKKYFEKDAALTRRFQIIKVDEPTEELAVTMMRNLVPSLEKHHQVLILDEAVIAAVKFSKRYISGRQLPDKCVSLLDTACARVRLSQTAVPAVIEDHRQRLLHLQEQEATLQREVGFGADHGEMIQKIHADRSELEQALSALNKQWQAEKELVAKLQQHYGSLTKSKSSPESIQEIQTIESELKALQGEKPLIYALVNEQIIAEVIGSWTGIPVGKMLSNEIKAVNALASRLTERIIGQDHAIKMIAERMQMARANLIDPQKPQGVFLLVGSSGVGKTETALALADMLYGGEQALTVINMSEFKEEHKISLLMGSPPGYVGYGEGGVLTEAVRRRPYSVILLDEMEKAHPNVQDVFYQVFDKGILMDGEGRLVDFRNTVIIMTSNACAESLFQLQQKAKKREVEDLVQSIYPDLTRHFKPAFLGRLNVIPYMPLSETDMKAIVIQKLQKIQNRMKSHYDATVQIHQEVITAIAARCQNPEIGARHIDHVINQQLLPKLANECLSYLAEDKKIAKVKLVMTKKGEWRINMS